MNTKTLIKFINKLKRKYLPKTSLGKFLMIRDINIFLASFMGVEFMKDDFKLHIRSVIPMFLGFNYSVLIIYNLYYNRYDFYKALRPTLTAGGVIPSLILYGLVVMPSSRQKFHSMYNFAAIHIHKNSDISPRINYVCHAMANRLIISSIRICSIMFVAVMGTLAFPIYKIFFTPERELIFPIFLPFIDPKSEMGYRVNMGNQLMICTFGLAIIPAIELVTTVLKNTITAIAHVSANSLNDFAVMIQGLNIYTPERSRHFKNILKKFYDYDRYVVEFNRLYYWKFYLQPILLMYAVIVSIFLFMKTDWIPGVGVAMYCFIQILVLCNTGNSLEEAHDEIMSALNKFPYYLLPVKEQRLFIMIVGHMQNANEIRVGPFAAMNFELATKLTKYIVIFLLLMIETT